MRKHHEASPQDINFSKFFPSSAKTRAMKGTKTKQKKKKTLRRFTRTFASFFQNEN